MVAPRFLLFVVSTAAALRLDSATRLHDSPTCSCGCCIVPTREDDIQQDNWLHAVQGHSVYGCSPIFNSQPFLHRKFSNCEPLLINVGNFCRRPGSGSAFDANTDETVDINHFCFNECMPSTVTPKGIGRECIPIMAQSLAATPTLPPTTAPPAAAMPDTVLDASAQPTTPMPPMPEMKNEYVPVSGGTADIGDCKTESGEHPCAWFGGPPEECETTCNELPECIGYIENSVDNCMLMFPCSRMTHIDLNADLGSTVYRLFDGPHSGDAMVNGTVCTGEEMPACTCMRRLKANEDHVEEPPSCECVRVQTNIMTTEANCGMHGHTDETQPWCYVHADAVCDDPQPHEEDESAPGYKRRYCERSEEPAAISDMGDAVDTAGDILAGAANRISESITEENPQSAPPISNTEGASAALDSLAANSNGINEVAEAVSHAAGPAVHVAGGHTHAISSNIPDVPQAQD